MAISLIKGQKISLDKEAGSSLNNVFMGLGWDAVKKKGFFASFSDNSIDLDASCALFDENKNIIDVVYFGKLQGGNGSIKHSGDNLTGEGDGDDEKINVNLSAVPDNVKSIIFTVNSFRGQKFDEVENAYCRLVNAANNSEVAKFTLSGGGNHTAMIMAKVYKHNGEWKMHAIGEATNGRTIEDLADQMKSFA